MGEPTEIYMGGREGGKKERYGVQGQVQKEPDVITCTCRHTFTLMIKIDRHY